MSQLAFLDLEPSRAPTLEKALWEEPPSDMLWTYSAHSASRRCQLQYLFGFKMAAAKSLDPKRREAWVLSQLQDLARWRGRLVDYGMEHILVPALKAKRLPSLDDLINGTLAVARRQWDFSLGRQYWQPGLRKGQCEDDFCALYEHEYGIGIGDADRRRVEAEVAQAFSNLFRLDDFLDGLRQQRSYQTQRTLWVKFERAHVKAIPDLLCWHTPQYTLVDWKATESETSDHTWQMLVYALAVKRNWPQTRPDDILVYEVRLLEGVIIPHVITDARLLAAEDFLYQSVLEMEALTGNKSFAEQNREDYEPAQTSRTCATCNFRKICLERRD